MKLRLYTDVPPFGVVDGWVFYATSKPMEKMVGWKRYRIEFEIADPAAPDEVVQASAEEVLDAGPAT